MNAVICAIPAYPHRTDSRNTWIISEYRMKTEPLTHDSYKAVREVSVIFRAFAKKVKCLSSAKSENSVNFHFRYVIFVKNGLTKVKTLTFKRRLSNVTVVAEDSIIQHVIKSLM